MGEPIKLEGHLLKDKAEYKIIEEYMPGFQHVFDRVSLNLNELIMMQDDSRTWYPVYPKEILEQIARNHLEEDLRWLIEQVKKDSNN